jgi:hypothetical protein
MSRIDSRPATSWSSKTIRCRKLPADILDGVQNVALREDAYARVLGIHDDGCPDALRRHQPGRLAQGMCRPDTEDDLGHAIPHVHLVLPSRRAAAVHRRVGPRAGSLLAARKAVATHAAANPLGVLVRL